MSFSECVRRLAAVFGRDRAASELEEEMRLHVDLRARQLRQQGMPANEAGYAARRRFGNQLTIHDSSARVWGWAAWERLLGDFRHAFRSLRKAPGFTAVAVATLAVGLGMNVAVFSLVNAVMLRSLPYAEPERLVSLWEGSLKGWNAVPVFNSSGSPLGGPTTAQRTTVSVANLADYAHSPAFAALASFDIAAKNLTGLDTPERVQGEAVSANFFDVLGVKPALGRSFLPEEDRDGAAAAVILTDGFWRNRLGADTDVLARSISLDAQVYRIVGVLPPGFQSPYQLTIPGPVEFYVPAAYSRESLASRGNHDVDVVARLRPGVSVGQAQADLNVISANLGKQFPETNQNLRAGIAPLREDIARNVRQSLWILLGASALIVLIACVNLANLMLVRAARRQHESSVRMALGGGRWSLVRQYLAESLTLAGAGCAAGMAVGYVLMRVLVWLAPQNIPRIRNVNMDWQVFAAAAAVALATGLVFGVAPAWQASRTKAAEALKTSARSTGGRAQARWRSALTAAEIALSLILLVGAGLLLRSFVLVMGVDLGFQPERVLALNINLPDLRYADADRRLTFFEELERRVTALPGVEAVAFANRLPLRGGWSSDIALETSPDVVRDADCQAVSPGYFETLGIALERGRLLVPSDRKGQPPVAVVNQAFARQFLAGSDPIGRHFHRGSAPLETIVGVVNDIRRGGKTGEINPQVYFSAAQTDLYPVRLADFAVRTHGDPRQLVNAVQRQIWAIDKDQPVTNVRTLEEVISRSVEERRFQMVLLIAFAAVAVLLATIGIFGVLSYIVNQRMGELGIRVALGATPLRIVAIVLRQAGWWVAVGIGAGLAGAFALARYLESLLFEVHHGDPWTYTAAVALLLAVSLVAALIPARRGARVDPMTALRYE